MIFAFFKIRIKKKKSADQKPDFVMAILNKDYISIYYSACHPFGEPVYDIIRLTKVTPTFIATFKIPNLQKRAQKLKHTSYFYSLALIQIQ